MPSGTWRMLNQGIVSTNTGALQVDESIGLLENRAEIDLVTARLSSDIPAYRRQKGNLIIRGLAAQLETTLIYGDTTTYPGRFHGLHPRYNALGQKTNSFGANNMSMNQVVGNGGTTNLSSIWLIGWGENKVYGIYPQGSPIGIESEDLGVIDLRDVNGGVFRGYAEHFRVQMGLAVEDWRYVSRLCNVDVAGTINDANMTVLLNNMIDMTMAIPDLQACRPCFYCNRKVKAYLMKMAYTKANLALSIGDVYDEKNLLLVNGIPLRQADSITLTESQIS
jgi:hypothetical protein